MPSKKDRVHRLDKQISLRFQLRLQPSDLMDPCPTASQPFSRKCKQKFNEKRFNRNRNGRAQSPQIRRTHRANQPRRPNGQTEPRAVDKPHKPAGIRGPLRANRAIKIDNRNANLLNKGEIRCFQLVLHILQLTRQVCQYEIVG